MTFTYLMMLSRIAEIVYTFANTSPLYEVDFAFTVRDSPKRSFAMLGRRQLTKILPPQQTFTWKTSARELNDLAVTDCLVAWQLRLSVGQTIDGQWHDRATFTMG